MIKHMFCLTIFVWPKLFGCAQHFLGGDKYDQLNKWTISLGSERFSRNY